MRVDISVKIGEQVAGEKGLYDIGEFTASEFPGFQFRAQDRNPDGSKTECHTVFFSRFCVYGIPHSLLYNEL
jgi:hypothetical protein